MPGPDPSVTRVSLWRSFVWGAAFAVALVLLYLFAVVNPAGQMIDASSLGNSLWESSDLFVVLRPAIPLVLALLALAAVATGLIQRRWLDTTRCVVVAAVLILSAGPLRDDVFYRPFLGDFGYLDNSYPSRHVVVGLALCVVILRLWPWRRSLRVARIVAVVAVTVLAVASIATFAHRASDVIGGVLVVGVLAPVVAAGRVPTARAALNRRPPVLGALAAALVTCTVFVLLPVSLLSEIGWSILVPLAVAPAVLVVSRVAVPVQPFTSPVLREGRRQPAT